MPVRDLTLRSSRFRDERESEWAELEQLLSRVEGGSVRRLSDEDLLKLPQLYRAALSSLSVARSISLDRALTDYLEGLCARAYFVVYGVQERPMQRVAQFFRRDWPEAVQALWRETLFALLLGLASMAVAWWLVSNDPDWYFSFVPQELASGRDPSATTEYLRHTLYSDPNEREALGLGSTMLFTHNAQVSIMTFSLGFAFGVPTALLCAMNGGMFGAFMALFSSHGLGFEAFGWLMIHGVTELFAITLACACGFRVGLALAFPGERTRLDSLRHAGRTVGLAMGGVVLMLVCAGVLEGVGRQIVTWDWARYTIAGLTLLLWTGYFYLPRRGDGS